MIKGITAGRYIDVQGGQPGSTYINNYSNSMGVGNVRYNTSNQNMEVFDGSGWQQLMMSYATVNLTSEAQVLLDWARQERDRQLHRQALIKNHPALEKAWSAIVRAEENFDLLQKFVENDKQSESESVQSSP